MGVFRVALEGFISAATKTINVFTFDSGGGGLPTNAEVSTWLDTLYTASVLSGISNAWGSTRFIIEEPDGAGHWAYRDEAVYLRAGSSNGEPFPQQSALVVVGITPSRRRGKKFIACIPESGANNGVVTAAFLTTFQAYGVAWIASMTVGIGNAFSGVCKPDGTDFLAFTSSRVDIVMGTQRRRKQGVGV